MERSVHYRTTCIHIEVPHIEEDANHIDHSKIRRQGERVFPSWSRLRTGLEQEAGDVAISRTNGGEERRCFLLPDRVRIGPQKE